MAARRHVTNKLRTAYTRASKADKNRILDEVIATVRKLVRALRPLRDVNIRIAGDEITATTPPSPEATAILDALSADAGH